MAYGCSTYSQKQKVLPWARCRGAGSLMTLSPCGSSTKSCPPEVPLMKKHHFDIILHRQENWNFTLFHQQNWGCLAPHIPGNTRKYHVDSIGFIRYRICNIFISPGPCPCLCGLPAWSHCSCHHCSGQCEVHTPSSSSAAEWCPTASLRQPPGNGPVFTARDVPKCFLVLWMLLVLQAIPFTVCYTLLYLYESAGCLWSIMIQRYQSWFNDQPFFHVFPVLCQAVDVHQDQFRQLW